MAPTLNEALRLVRIYHDKSQTEMAELLGLSKSYLSEIENGHKAATLSLLRKYSDALDVPISSLMFFAEELEGVDDRLSKPRIMVTRKVLSFLKLLAGEEAASDQQKPRATSD